MNRKYKVKRNKNKKPMKAKANQVSDSQRSKSVGSEEFSVMGAMNEAEFRAPIDVLAVASQMSGRFVPPEEVKSMAKKSKKKVRRKSKK